MRELNTDTHWARIYIAGPITGIEQSCREYVLTGLCVTVTPTNYIYTGGEETGAIIELINYPRFPTTHVELLNTAGELANKIMVNTHQVSYTIMTPIKTYYYSRRKELGVR